MYIYNEKEDTDCIQQLKGYRQLDYYDDTQKSLLGIRPKEIIVIYPKQNNDRKFIVPRYQFILMPIKLIDINKNFVEYDEFKNEIINLVFQNIDL